MTGTHRAGGYRRLLSDPATRRTFVLSSLGRGGYAMLPLLLLFTIRQATGSFAVAAAAMSIYALTTLVMPVTAMLIDRFGQRVVLPPLAIGECLALGGASAAGILGMPQPHLWFAVCVLGGLLAPPLGPSMRAQWRAVAPDDLDATYALDAVTEEVLWLAGPAIAGGLLATGPAVRALPVIPALLLLGAMALALSPAGRLTSRSDDTQEAGPARRGALRHRPLWPVLLTMLAFGCAVSLLATGVAARADHLGRPGLAGIAETAIGVGAVTGGYLWGRLRHSHSRGLTVAGLMAPWAIAVLVSTQLDLAGPALPALALAGAMGAPMWVVAYRGADAAVPPAARTEASTWVTTASNLGGSGGTALAGVLAASLGATSPVLAAGTTASVVCAVSALALVRGRVRR